MPDAFSGRGEAMPSKLAVLAGSGPLPGRVIEACRREGRPVVVVALKDITDPALTDGVEHFWLRLGASGGLPKKLHDAGSQELCMVGRFRRPSLTELMPDWRTLSMLVRIGFAAAGDDALMRAIRDEFEARGIRIVSVQDVISGLVAPAGTLTEREPDAQARADIDRGIEVAQAVGRVDVGQGAVVQQGVVLAIEAAEGTDAMLARCGGLRRDGAGGVLVKTKKPQQDDNLDLPVIGVSTVEAAAAAGLRGIAVEAGSALIVDRDEVSATADRLGLFVVGVTIEPAEGG